MKTSNDILFYRHKIGFFIRGRFNFPFPSCWIGLHENALACGLLVGLNQWIKVHGVITRTKFLLHPIWQQSLISCTDIIFTVILTLYFVLKQYSWLIKLNNPFSSVTQKTFEVTLNKHSYRSNFLINTWLKASKLRLLGKTKLMNTKEKL